MTHTLGEEAGVYYAYYDCGAYVFLGPDLCEWNGDECRNAFAAAVTARQRVAELEAELERLHAEYGV